MIPRAIAALLAALWCVIGAAHPFHGSFAEIGWSEDRKRLEIALRVQPEDLEGLLAQHRPRPRSLEWLVQQRRDELAAYLRGHLRLVPASAATGPLTLLGMATDAAGSWLFLEQPADSDQAFALEHTLLFELGPGQLNRVRRLWAPDAPILVFSAEEPRREFWVSAQAQTP